MALTPEELKELQELEELERLEAMETREANLAPTVEQMEKAKAEVEPTMMEAASAGVVEGIPFLKDAVSAYDGISDAMEEDNVSFDSAYSAYKEKLDETNKDLNRVESKSPGAFMAGDIAGTAASFAAGGAALRAAGAGATLTPLGADVAAGATVGAASQLSRSEDRGLTDVAAGAAMGGVAELGGHYVMKGVKKAGRYLMDKADDVGIRSAERILGIKNVSTRKAMHKHLKRTKQKESEFMNDVLTQKMKDSDEMMINFSDSPERMLDKISIRKEQIGDDIGKLYKEVDSMHKVEIDIEDLKSGLRDDVLPQFMNSDDPGMNAIGAQLDEYISQIGRRSKGIKKEVTPEGTKLIEEIAVDNKWTLSRTHKLQKDIRKRIEKIYKANGMDLNAAKEQQRQVAQSLGKHMDEVLEHVSSDADDVIGIIKKRRLEFGNVSSVKDTLEAEIFRAKDEPIAMIKEALGLRSLMMSGVATSAVGPMGLVVGPILNKVIHNPKTPLYLSEGVKKVSQVIQAAPTGYIATKLNSAALMGNEKFKTTMYGAIAEINLKQQPLARSSEEIIRRQADIRHLIKDKQPQSLADFDKVMESNDPDQIAGFMDQVSKVEGVSKLFQPGIGIDGKVYNEMDKATLEQQLKSSDLPAAQRMEMLDALRKNGIVPDFNSVVIPEPKRHIPRIKKMHDF